MEPPTHNVPKLMVTHMMHKFPRIRWHDVPSWLPLSIAATFGVILGPSMALPGCAADTSSRSPYSPQQATSRDPINADRLCRQAADLLDSDPVRAEELLRRALALDLFHGPSHNNLGIVLLNRGDLYEASEEFEWARKLLPGHPDPRVNLAITLERAGRTQEAAEAYRAAIEIAPEYYPALLGLTRLELLTGKHGPDLAEHLRVISLRASSQSERDWAVMRLHNLRQE